MLMGKRLTADNIKATFDARYKGRPPILARDSKHRQGLPMLEVALGGLQSKVFGTVCHKLQADLTPAVDEFLFEMENLVCGHIETLFPTDSESDRIRFLQILNRFRHTDVRPRCKALRNRSSRRMGPS